MTLRPSLPTLLALGLAAGLTSGLTSGCADDLGQTSHELIDYGTTPLQLSWMKASHNTYQAGHHLGGLLSVLGPYTHHVELDLRDTSSAAPGGAYVGNWVVAHDSGASSATSACPGGITFAHCLAELAAWHQQDPWHPLLTVWIDKKQAWQNLNASASARSPWRLDDLIGAYFSDSAVLRPAEVAAGYSLRSIVETSGWPSHLGLRGRVMFILTSDAGCTGNDRLEAYVDSRGVLARAFIAPSGESASYVTSAPNCFDAASTQWAAIYNFEWRSGSGTGVDECNAGTCYQIPTAHARNYLTRVWDIDDAGESDAASERPWGGSYGHANFIAVDYPWQQGGAGGYGAFPDGIYPW